MIHQFSAGGVVFTKTPECIKILLIQDFNHKWTLPKGHIEKGESSLDSAIREIREETNLQDLTSVQKLPKIEYWFVEGKKKIFKTVQFYLLECQIYQEPKVQEEEGIEDAQWKPLGEAVKLVQNSGYKNTIEIIKKAIQYIRSCYPREF